MKRGLLFQTLYMQGFASISGYFSYSDALGTESAFYFDPAADIQYRYYYKGMKRSEMEKRTEMNSMNYVTVMSEFIFSKMRLSTNYVDESKRRAISRFGIGWGFQRNYASHFSLDLNLGLGYLISKESNNLRLERSGYIESHLNANFHGTNKHWFLAGQKKGVTLL